MNLKPNSSSVRNAAWALVALLATAGCGDDEDTQTTPTKVTFSIVDTGQTSCYGYANKTTITCPAEGADFHGQDGSYPGVKASYTTLEQGQIVQDNNTGLMWEQGHHTTKLTWSKAKAACEALTLGGYSDWRLASIKELYSIATFNGSVGGEFFLDSKTFKLEIPTTGSLTGTHNYNMMGQTWSSTARPDDASMGYYFFNFLDGHIKSSPDSSKFEHFYRCVRGDASAFANSLKAGTSTVTDSATGLTWQKDAAPSRMAWKEALAYCEGLSLDGHSDWRLPDVKELQSIVAYDRTSPSLDTTAFGFKQESGKADFFWSSTSMLNYPDWACYVCFGPCQSMTGKDIHGPGAQRADPKIDKGKDWTAGVGDQKDMVQISNYVRCVR